MLHLPSFGFNYCNTSLVYFMAMFSVILYFQFTFFNVESSEGLCFFAGDTDMGKKRRQKAEEGETN